MENELSKNRKLLLGITICLIVIVIITVLLYLKNNSNSSYEIISSTDKEEFNYGKEICEEILIYLENKYNEKFHITYEWYSEEGARLSKIQAYSYNNPDSIFRISKDIYGFNDTYITVLAKEDVYEYFYKIFGKYDINKNDFLVSYYEVNDLNICKECFNEEQSISFNIFLDNNEFSKFEKNLSDISKDLNNSISYKNSYSIPNFFINLYTKETVNYNDTISDDNYVSISIYDNHYSAYRVHSFPENLFNSTYANF